MRKRLRKVQAPPKRLQKAQAPLPGGALEQWNALVQEQLDAGMGHLPALEAVDKANPGLWAAATAEVARRTGPGPVSGG